MGACTAFGVKSSARGAGGGGAPRPAAGAPPPRGPPPQAASTRSAATSAGPSRGHARSTGGASQKRVVEHAAARRSGFLDRARRERRQPADRPPAPGVGGLPGRTLTAFGATVSDATRQIIRVLLGGPRRVGGLRRGTLTVSARGRGTIRDTRIALRNYETVTGVRVTGSLVEAGRLRFT